MTIRITYATGSKYKQAEIGAILANETVSHKGKSVPLSDLFEVEFQGLGLPEQMDVDLQKLVVAKAKSAYEVIKRPCIVEYAGLVLDVYATIGYPGGLTQPMWDTLEAANFVKEMGGHGRAVRARAYVGYCDGLTIQTFMGETKGKLVGTPSGTRPFYWDPVFAPRGGNGKTYAEICPDDRESSLLAKVKLSQSAKALRKFLEFRLNAPRSALFPDR